MRISLVLLALSIGRPQAGALTIYRIGGAGLEPPELDAPYEFVQLDWAGQPDHGEHGLWWKQTFYEDSAKVPAIIAPPTWALMERNLISLMEESGRLFARKYFERGGGTLLAEDVPERPQRESLHPSYCTLR